MFRSIDRFEGVSYCAGGDLALVVWSGASTLEANRWVIRRTRTELLGLRSRGLLLQVVPEAATPPNAETRKYIQQEFSVLLPQTSRFVTVPLGGSLNQSVVRTIMRGMILISGMSQIAKVASSLEEGLALLFEKATPETPPRAESLRKLQQMMAEAGVAR
jgi:hypothetical protein